jgi:preprotein translocase subunit SecG
MDVFLMIATVIIAITLISVVLLQGQGSGLGSAFGGDAGVHRTRRGVEKTMFNLTLTLASLFLLLSLVSVALH